MSEGGINFEAWATNAVQFIRLRGLEREFADWCGGWNCPIVTKPSETAADTGSTEGVEREDDLADQLADRWAGAHHDDLTRSQQQSWHVYRAGVIAGLAALTADKPEALSNAMIDRAYAAVAGATHVDRGLVADVLTAALGVSDKPEAQGLLEVGRPFSEWNEDHRDVVWWKLPIQEGPYVGTPLDLGRSMKVVVQVGLEEHDLPITMTGGWPFDDEDEGDLWWTPLPTPTFARTALNQGDR